MGNAWRIGSMGLIRAESRTWMILRRLIANPAKFRIAQEVGGVDDLNIEELKRLCTILKSYDHGITITSPLRYKLHWIWSCCPVSGNRRWLKKPQWEKTYLSQFVRKKLQNLEKKPQKKL